MSNTLAQAAVGVERVQALLETDMTTPERPDALDPPPLTGEITFDRVAFQYQKDQPVLKDVSFVAKGGQMIGIVGPTGSGKSTVMSLIPRFYDPTSGTIQINGINICALKLQPFRDRIGYVLQDTILFRGTVTDNIAFGRNGATREQVIAAAKAANADESLAKSAPVMTPWSAKGAQLLLAAVSASASASRESCCVIVLTCLLDEPTAALDSESERTVIECARVLNEKSHRDH